MLPGAVNLSLPRDVDTYVRLAALDISVDKDSFDQSRLKKTIKEGKYVWEGERLMTCVSLYQQRNVKLKPY